jgi:nitroreductase
METLEAIKTRRSIRKFKPQPVSRQMVKELLEAAMFAPSAGNEQPWQFIVVDERKILDDVPGIGSAAVQNLLLAAHALGLGAVWASVYPLKDRVEGFRRLFSLPEGITPFALVPLGYPDQKPGLQERYREERVHYNGW